MTDSIIFFIKKRTENVTNSINSATVKIQKAHASNMEEANNATCDQG